MATAIQSSLKFLANLDEPLVYIPSKGGGDETEHVGNFVPQAVDVYDARTEKPNADVDVEGFRLVPQRTSVDDFYDDEQIRNVYHKEITNLLKNVTGAKRVEIFDDTRRSASTRRQAELGIREPAAIVHNDYTAASGVKRLQDHFADAPDDAESLLKNRFAIINVWRSIAGTVRNHSLALCDATSMPPESLVSMERRADERIGELQVALYDDDQRWYYYPDLDMDEAILIKTFDSSTDGRARFTAHTSFEAPDAPANAPIRESLETRCLVFF